MSHNLPLLPADIQTVLSRRHFLRRGSIGIGTAALGSLLQQNARADSRLPSVSHFIPRAKRIIWLTQAGAPSQLELYDYKPGLAGQFDNDLPDSVRRGQRLTGMTSSQERLPIAPSIYRFRQHGQSGIWLSELLPHTARLADRMCLVRSLYTEAINHDPAMTLLQTGHQIAGRPSLGAWLSYGLGSENDNLPAYVVMISRPSGPTNAQPLHERMWGAGFLPASYQGVRFSAGKNPVLFLSDLPGITNERRRRLLDDLAALNRIKLSDHQDPETQVRIEQYELAFRMQAAVPELADVSQEPERVFEQYGPESRKPGTYAANCILARRLAERGDSLHTALSPRLGPTQQSSQRRQKSVLRHRSADRGVGGRPGLTWNARRYLSCLGWRVWPDGLFTRHVDHDQLRPRPSSPLLQHVDGGGRSTTGHGLWGDGRLFLQHRQRPCAYSRPERDRAAPDGHRSHAADLPTSRTRLPTHRHSRRGVGKLIDVSRRRRQTVIFREPH